MNWELKEISNDFSFKDPLKNKNFRMAKAVLGELISFADSNGVTYIGIRTISNNLGKSTKTVNNHLKILEDLKIVKNLNITGSFGKSSYRQISFNVVEDAVINVVEDVVINVVEDVVMGNTKEKISKVKDKEETNASLRSATLSLISKKDIKGHSPYKVLKDLNDLLPIDIDEEVIEYMKRFIEYRDEMFNTTKDKKYALKTYRSIQGFINQLFQAKDIEKAFELMEDNEWASYKIEYETNKKGK
jgi:hypothetical protein